MRLREFHIDRASVCQVTIVKEWSKFQDRTDLTGDELMEVIMGQDRCTSTHSEDHPDFAELRVQLGRSGYISIQPGWWNGDRVLRPFKLNGAVFRRGEQFSCGAALGWTLDRKLKDPRYQTI